MHLAARQVLDDLFQGRILLPHDVVEADRLDAGLLQLLIRSAGVDGLVLADVADEQHAVVRIGAGAGSRASASCSPGSTRRRRRDVRVRSCGVLVLRSRWRCKVRDGMPASASFWAARDVGANPSTR